MNVKQSVQTLHATHDYMQQRAISSVNQSLSLRNWLFGFYIVEYEQKGKDRAKYGEQLLKTITSKTSKQIKGINDRYLRDCRRFYITYPQLITLINHLSLPEHIWRSAPPKSKTRKKTDSIGVKPKMRDRQ